MAHAPGPRIVRPNTQGSGNGKQQRSMLILALTLRSLYLSTGR